MHTVSNAFTGRYPTYSAIWFVCATGAAIAIASALVVMGSVYGGHAMLQDYPVDWTVLGLVRVGGTALAAGLLFSALNPSRARARPVEFTGREGRFILLLTMLSVLTLVASAAAVIWFPQPLFDAVDEGKPIAVATELALAAALVWLAVTAWRARIFGKLAFLALRPSLILAAMAGVVFLILMEEMSWGQHLFGWGAGELFEANIQHETNLHNFATNKFEAMYYTVAVAAFVVLPHVWPRSVGRMLGSLEFLVPPRAFALAALPVAGLIYQEWNVVPYQIWFFLGLLIALSARGALKRQDDRQARLVSVLVLALVGAQAVFLVKGPGLSHGYEVSEIRELVIAVLVASYAFMLHRRVADAARAVVAERTAGSPGPDRGR
tara:strand:+ start:440 stop:1576 length:1137 start_codon:yes stop_codon:yes gene_type:complete